MKKLLLLLLLAMSSLFASAQHAEYFENETNDATQFSEDGQTFTITNAQSRMRVQGSYPGTGWNGTAKDNKYIDNSNYTSSSQGFNFTISSLAGFRMSSVWLYVSTSSLNLSPIGTITIVGKLAGVTKFTLTKSNPFNPSASTNNGFTYFDFSNFFGSGTDVTGINIDALQISSDAGIGYLSVDAFKWYDRLAPAVVATGDVSNIGTTTATLTSTLSDIGNPALTDYGVVYGTSADPTTSNTKAIQGTSAGVGSYSTDLTGLTPGATYYARPYAINTVGTAYGTSTSFTTNKQEQTITFAPVDAKTYGDADFAPGATASTGLAVSYASDNTAVATIVNGNLHIVGAGTANITASQAGNASTLAANNVVQTVTVNKKTITITPVANQTKVYGNDDPTNYTYSITSGALKSGDAFSGKLARDAGSNVGTYPITIGTLSLGNNYALTLVDGNFAITKRPLSLYPVAQTKVYGNDDPPSYPYQFINGTSVAPGEGMTGVFTREPGNIPGVYALSLGNKRPVNAGNGAETASNYEITFTSNNLTITKRPITMAPASKVKSYGDADPFFNQFMITAGSLAPGHATSGAFGRVEGEAPGTYSLAAIATKVILDPALGYAVVNQYYDITIVPGTFTISRKNIAITATAQTKAYGDTDPELTYTTDASLASGDSFTGTLARAAGETVGTYAISQGTLALNSNYNLSFTGANLAIDKKTINVAATAQNKTFGDSDPALAYTADALANGESFTGAITREAGENFGTYAISQGTLGLSSNYTLNFTGANFSINKKIINVTAAAQTKTYGDTDPALTYTADPLLAGDAFTGNITRTAGEAAGDYNIGQGSLALGSNYALNYTPANFTIGKRPIRVDYYGGEVPYGNPDQSIGYAYIGSLASGDAFSGSLSREAGSAIGSYAVTLGTLTLTNSESYAITLSAQPYKIVPREIIVTGGPVFKIYGDPDPALTYSIYSGSLLAGTQITGALERVAGETAGPYNIGQGTLAINDANYKLTYLGGYFEIDRAPLTLTIDNKTKVATKPNPALTYSVSGYKNGDTEATAFTTPIQLLTDAAVYYGAGSYNIYTNGSLSTPNYNLTITGGTLTVTPASTVNTLASVSIPNATFEPAFDPATEFYMVTVPNGTTSTTITPVVTDPLSAISIGYDPNNGTPLASGTPYTVSADNGGTQVPVNVRAEDGTVKSYYFNVSPVPSDSKLSNLVTSAGTLTPSFDADVTSYTLNVSAETDSITITPTTHDPLATARVSGEGGANGPKRIAVYEGGTPAGIYVSSADRTHSTSYQLYIKRPVRLKTLTLSAGSLYPAFDPNVTSYVAIVPAGVPAITVTPLGNQDYFNITANGSSINYGDASAPVTINEDGSTTIAVTITAGDGETSKTYTISARRPTSVSTLAGITLSAGSLSPVFDSNVTAYTVAVRTASLELTPVFTAAHATASVTVNGSVVAGASGIYPLSLVYGANTVVVTATAEDGITTKAYTLTINRSAALNDATLANITVPGGKFDVPFSSDVLSYNVSLPFNVYTASFTPTATNAAATLTVNGSPIASGGVYTNEYFYGGTYFYHVAVTSEDGSTTKTYTLALSKAEEPALTGIALSAGDLSPVFQSWNDNYTAFVSDTVTSITITPTANGNTHVVKVNGVAGTSGVPSAPVSLAIGDNVIPIEVASAEGLAGKTYSLTVTRTAVSPDNYLSALTLSEGRFLYPFDKNSNFSQVLVPGSVSQFTVTPVARDSKATITVNYQTVLSGMASQPLAVGSTYQIIVTAENGSTRTYYLQVKPFSTNAKLYRLETTSGALSPTFNRDVVSYSLTVPANVSSTGIIAQAADTTARMSINGSPKQRNFYEYNVALGYGVNTIQVAVSPQEGPDNIYTISITRTPLSPVATLAALGTSSGSLSPAAFNPNTLSYTTAVSSNTASVTITAKVTDTKAKISVNGVATADNTPSAPIALVAGINPVSVTVTAEDGTVKTYTVNVKRAASAIATLSKLYLVEPSVTKTNVATGPGDYNSTAAVTASTKTIKVVAVATDSTATIRVNGIVTANGAVSAPVTLNADSTFITIQVTAANNTTIKNYVIKVTKPLSAVATLSKLYLVEPAVEKANTSTGPGDFNSTATVSAHVNSIKVVAVATDAGATIRVNGVVTASGAFSDAVTLSGTATNITVEVTAPNNTTVKTYVIKVTKDVLSSVATLSKLYLVSPAVTKTNVSSGPADYNSTASVSATTKTIKVVAVATDTTATIRINGVITVSGAASAPVTLNVGQNTINIVVTAQNGTTTRSWAIIVTKPAPAVIAAITNRPNTIDVVQPADEAPVAQPEDITVKQAVSPNGDGINDRFTIEGITAFPENKVQVMNRNGEVIYEAKGYDNQGMAFDGHGSKGTMQQPGTYFYSIEYKKNGQTLRKTGYLVLKY